MVALKVRSTVTAAVAESTAGTLAWPASTGDFCVARAGTALNAAMETVESDEMFDNIGMAEPFVTKQVPTGTVPRYLKGSGVEGTEPEWAVFLDSLLGDKQAQSNSHHVVASSTAGTSAAAAVLKLGSGQGAQKRVGEAILIKDGTNGYSIRNAASIATDDATLNFNLTAAPASGVLLGKSVHWRGASSGHSTFSLHLWQASSSNGVHEAVAGCVAASASIECNANELAMINFEVQGTKAFRNAMRVTSSNKYIDFNIGGSELNASLTEGSYSSPIALAREIATKMTALAGETISCSFSATTGKFTISKASGTLELLWDSGTNTANTAGTLLGYTVSADDTGSTSYTADSALDYSPAYTPSLEATSPHVVRHNELFVGAFSRNQHRVGASFTVSIENELVDVDDIGEESGVLEKLVQGRSVSVGFQLLVKKHEAEEFDAMLNNTTTQVMFNTGPKSGGNWVEGKCWNFWFPNVKLTAVPMTEKDGYYVYECEASGFCSASSNDVHVNQV